MKKLLQRVRNFAEDVSSRFFLRKHQPLPATMEVLSNLYPEMDWQRVSFYEGLPWFTPIVAPFVNAQALPDFYSCSRFRIYLRKFDETRAQCVADIAHEAFHILQAMQHARGYGAGFLRIWLIYYLAVYMKHGYRQNPFEVPAYDQEYRFLSFCERHNISGVVPPIPQEKLANLTVEPDLVHRNFNFKYGEDPLRLVASFALCVVVTVARPLVDVMMYLFLCLAGKTPTRK
jgi:hypothetical protein